MTNKSDCSVKLNREKTSNLVMLKVNYFGIMVVPYLFEFVVFGVHYFLLVFVYYIDDVIFNTL